MSGPGAHPARRLAVRAAAFAAVLAAAVWSAGELVRRVFPWEAAQDPRRRILWDEDPGRFRFFLLGDSVFASNFVDRAGDTLWARLSALLGDEVFPGALSGASGDEIALEADLVARTARGRGGVAFIDVVPMRLLTSAELSGDDDGCSRTLARRFAAPLRVPFGLRAFDDRLWCLCTKPFFLLRNREAVEGLVRAAAHAPAYFGRGDQRDRVWDDGTGFACLRFSRVLGSVRRARGEPPLDWIARACDTLRGAGIRPVVVFFPVNRAVLEACTGQGEGAELNRSLTAARDRMAARLRAAGVDVLDLLDGVASEGFADYDHTNARGDEAVARELHAWLLSHGLAAR